MNAQEPRLGIDIGNVIIGGAHVAGGVKRPDTDFLTGTFTEAMDVPAVPGALETIRDLVPLFSGRAWLISKCGFRIQSRTLEWLYQHKFYTATGVRRNHVMFCRRREDKRGICAEQGITHFVDDRVDVLKNLDEVVEHRYLFGSQSEDVFLTDDGARAPEWSGMTLTPNWDIAGQLIRRTLIRSVTP